MKTTLYNIIDVQVIDWLFTFAMKDVRRGHPSAKAATPAAVIISHQEMLTLKSWKM